MVSTHEQLAALAAVVAVIPQAVLGVTVYGQCGGIGYTGSAVCDAGSTCIKSNDYYSQCLPGSFALTTTTGGGGGVTVTSAPPTTTTDGLDARIKAKGKKYFGTSSDSALLSNSQNVDIIKAQFGSLTHVNGAKWDTIEASQNNFDFSHFDTFVNFAQTNRKIVRGHTLIWHSQLPSWVSIISSPSTLTSVLTKHINTIAKRYSGKIYAWDILESSMMTEPTASPFGTTFLGPASPKFLIQTLACAHPTLGFVATAFNLAHAADPNAKLYINDYNLDNMGWAAPKVNAISNMVNSQIAAGTPIHGIGTQTHLSGGDTSGLAAAWSTLANSGVGEIAITELDIAGASAIDYSNVVRTCLGQVKCIGITVWGVSDKDSGRSSGTPLLYDSNYQPKAAYNAVNSALS
ncbi:endo-beta-1,4-xylanase [Ceratobasidium sp. AG-Ba]|nr:endo-beta-1,4-xylanase [Ceratobasidium sp. AG-Ba]